MTTHQILTIPVEAHRTTDKRYANQRWATRGFFAVVVAAIPLYLVLGRHAWFHIDDWDFLTDRSATSLHDLFRPHDVHWTTLPILLYRALFNVFGLHHYKVFELPGLLLHLTAAVLLWFIIRRLGVRPWIAALVGSVFVLFGAGYQDIIWDFQVTFNGALVFGLSQLLLADHDGPIDQRDYLAIACGVLGLMCAGLAITMVFVVGLVMLIRRGWRVALLQTGPPAAIYGGWWLAIGRHGYDTTTSSLPETVQFVWRAITSTFENVSPLPATAAFMMLVIAFGMVVAWHRRTYDRTTTSSAQRLAVPVAMLAGVVVFAAITGYGRASQFGTEAANSSRYWHIILALSLPALAVAIDALTNLWRWAAVVIGAVMVIGIPTNLRAVSDATFGNKDLIIAMANDPLVRNVPEGDVPDRVDAKFVTTRWLVENVDNGRIPTSRSSGVTAADATISLSLNQDKGTPSSCRLVTRPVDRRFAPGDVVEWRGGKLRISLLTGAVSTGSVLYGPSNGYNKLRAVAPIDVRIGPVGPTFLCR